MDSDRYFVMDCIITPENNTVARGEEHVHLEPKVMDCLIYFFQHSNEILSRDELIHSVWQDRTVNVEAVNRVIYQIRHTFQALGIEEDILVTHRKRGYQWLPHVEHSQQRVHPDIVEQEKHDAINKLLITLNIVLFIGMVVSLILLWSGYVHFDHDHPKYEQTPLSSSAN
jgi:DNA-binding winged helix-turn-helix (wHTH) protein